MVITVSASLRASAPDRQRLARPRVAPGRFRRSAGRRGEPDAREPLLQQASIAQETCKVDLWQVLYGRITSSQEAADPFTFRLVHALYVATDRCPKAEKKPWFD